MSVQTEEASIVYGKASATARGKTIAVKIGNPKPKLLHLEQDKQQARLQVWNVLDSDKTVWIENVSMRDAKKMISCFVQGKPFPVRKPDAIDAYGVKFVEEYCHGDTWVSNSKWLVRRIPQTEPIYARLLELEKFSKERAGLKVEANLINVEPILRSENKTVINDYRTVFGLNMQPVVLFTERPDIGERDYAHCAHSVKLLDKYLGKTHRKEIQLQEKLKAPGVLYYVNKATLQIDAVLMPIMVKSSRLQAL